MRAKPHVHHIVFCVEPEHQDRAAELWRELGFQFAEIVLDDVGLRVLLDWTGGVEIISPTSSSATDARAFLDTHGDGVYSVVVRTDDIDAATDIARGHGASVALHHHRDGPGYTLEEVMLTPVLGMPVTLLATDLPD